MLTIHCSIPSPALDLSALMEAKRLAESVAHLVNLMESFDGDGIGPQVAKCREILYRMNNFDC